MHLTPCLTLRCRGAGLARPRHLSLTHTQEWLGLTDSLQHIANVALLEHRLPRDSEDSTLWEGEELTVRYMLEEGKLNLCLRLMEDYKRGQAHGLGVGGWGLAVGGWGLGARG